MKADTKDVLQTLFIIFCGLAVFGIYAQYFKIILRKNSYNKIMENTKVYFSVLHIHCRAIRIEYFYKEN